MCIPERIRRFWLEDTVDTKSDVVLAPYRLYNLDFLELELDKPLGFHCSTSFLTTRIGKDACGMVWMSSADMCVYMKTLSSL